MSEQVAEFDRQLGFWCARLAGMEPLELPTDRPRPPVRSGSGGSVAVSIEAGIADGLRELARREGITMFVALLSVFQVLLAKYSGQDDIAVGVPAAGRNTLVLRGDLTTDPTVGELFRRVHECASDAYAHQDLPFEELVDELAADWDLSRTPLVQVWFALRDATAEPVRPGPGVSEFDLGMTVRDRGAELHVSLEYRTDLFDGATVERMAGHLRTLLAGVVADPRARLSHLELLSEAERRQILVEWNDTVSDYPRHRCVHQLIEQQSATSPDAVAVVFEDVRLSYRELNERANQLAHHLRGLGVGPEVLVGICVERGPEMIVGLLGILKAGGAYVPMDPAYPVERLAFMIEDTAAPVVVTQASLADRLPADTTCVLVRVDVERDGIAARPTTDPIPLAGPDNLAYVIYTSGSTGTPKGVQIQHGNLICRMWEWRRRFGLTASDRVLLFASLSFDSSVVEIFPALMTGASVVVRGKDFDPDALVALIRHGGVTVMEAPPSVWAQLLSSARILQLAESTLRTVILAGEAAPPSLLERWFEHSRTPLYNNYGPTETTVITTSAPISSPTSRVSIGRPIANTEVFVMDRFGRPVPVGVAGELWIGGAGVARGYLNRPELTVERFVPHPFSDDPAARVYRTGDTVRWLPDGTLEFIGRVDDQVKVRGFRIELGEVEAVLGAHESVGSCAAATRADPSGDKRLVAYVVAAGAGAPTWAQLRSFLKDRLPDHMVPSAFVALAALPLTPNGKVDRKALPAPDGQRPDVGDDYVAPRNELEEVTSGIWMQVLGIDKVGVQDDFFRLGGDSIVAIQLLGRLRQHFGVHLPVQELLDRPTVEWFCEFLGGELADLPRPVGDEDGQVDRVLGEAPLLPIQEWFFRNDFARPDHWNHPFLIATPQLDVGRLRECVRELGNRHGAFRLRYRRDPAGEVVQYYVDDYQPTDLVTGSVADVEDLQAQLTAWQADFDLEVGPVYRIGYLDGFADGSARVFVACHHLVVDAVSWRVLAEDLEALYHRRSLSPVGSTYRQWTMAVRQYASQHPEERDYWRQVQSGYDQTGSAALQRLVVSEDTMTVSQLSLDRDSTKQLLHCHRAYHTQINDVLLAAFTHASTDLTGESVNHVILEGHGREEIDPRLDVGRTVGWFTTMFPVRLQTGADQLATLRDTKETLRGIPAKGIGYGTLHGYDDERLPRINFNYLGRLDAEQAAVDDGRWRLTREPFGEAVHPANHDNIIMRINGWIVDGRFSLTIANKLGQELGDRLAQRYEQCLVELIGELSAASCSYLTPSDIDHVVSAQYLDELQSAREIEGVYLANSLQQGFVYQNITHGWDDDAYSVQLTWEYAAQIDCDAMRDAWIRAQRMFPALRLRFGWKEDVVQVIDAESTVDWCYVDLSERPADEAAASIRRLREADRTKPYNLGTGPLFRIYLVKLGSAHFSCIFSQHHSILDAWSNTILLSQVHELYEALVAGVPTATTPDRSYSSGQKYLQEHRKDHTEFWQNNLALCNERMDLDGLLRPDAREDGRRVAATRRVQEMRELSFTVSGEQLTTLHRLAQDSAVTMNALMLYVWHKILACYTGAQQTITGCVLSGRGIPVNDINTSVGLFINTLPVIVPHGTGDESVLDGIRAVQRRINDLNAHSTVKLAELHDGADRLFDTLFIYENWPKISPDGWQSRLAMRMGPEYEKLDYPLSVIVSEVPGSIRFRLAYAAELFDSRYMTDMLDMQRHLLDEVLADRERPWREVQPVSQASRREVAARLNPAAERLPPAQTLVEAFEGQARRHPERTAVTFEGATLTYGALEEQANRLAGVLTENRGVRPEELVVLCLDKGLDLIVSILAVLKARAAYVLTDPGYPDSRISYILQDTATPLVITTGRHFDRLSALGDPDNAVAVLALDAPEVRDALATASPTAPGTYAPLEALMYVLYTSGTTSAPKGVMIEHRAYGQTIAGVKARYFADLEAVNTYSLTNHVFDIFGLEYGLPLWTGGSVELASDLPTSLDCAGLDFVQLTPSVCDVMLDRLANVPAGLLLLVGGERLPKELLERVLAKAIDLVNVYGPTETTIWSTARLYRHADGMDRLPVSIGAPFAGESVHVLDAACRPLPMGATGELCIGGGGLARGYLNRSDLTAKQFVSVPSWPAGGARPVRLYRTGDLVRLLPSGTLEFIGRNDDQVKISGHRVELGEVNGVLASHPAVRQSEVLVVDLGSPALVGYYVADREIPEEELDKHLRRSLPGPLVPTRCVHLRSMPLTINGKVDRAALPRPSGAGTRAHVPPRSRTEADLCALTARPLGLDPVDVGIDHDFFELGGTSLLSIKLVSAVKRELGISTTVAYLLEHRTIREFAENLDGSRTECLTIPPATFAEPEDQKLSFAQERLWFIERFEGGTNAYNLPLVLRVADHVRTDTLLAAIRAVVCRHEILRTLLIETPDGTGYQTVRDGDDLDLAVVRVPDLATLRDAMRDGVRQIFDLAHDLPMRVRLYDVPAAGRQLLFVFHHVAFDGWSTDVLLADLAAAYTAITRAPDADPRTALPVPELQYRDFAVWQREHLTGERLDRLATFWRDKLDGYQNLDLIPDRPRPESPDYRGAETYLHVAADVSDRLRRLAAELRVSLFSLLCAAHSLALRCFSNQDDIVVGVPVANRDHQQLAGLIGFFVNTLPLRIRIDGTARVVDHVRATARETMDLLRHQELPLERLVAVLDVERDISRHPIFQVAFGVQSFGSPPRGRAEPVAPILRMTDETKRLDTVARFDLSTFVDDSQEALEVNIVYATSLFEHATVDSFAQTYRTILGQFAGLAGDEARQNECGVDDIAYLDGSRYREIIADWSAPQRGFDAAALLHTAVEKQARCQPDRTALVWKGRRTTYRELNEAANQLAHHLLYRGRVEPNDIVMLCLDRGDDIVISILAVLKAGAGYLPVDPSYPDDRVAFMLADAGARTIITHARHADRLRSVPAALAVDIVTVDDPSTQDRIDTEPVTDPLTDVKPDDVAYVLYTSGTTGRPKGVPQTHANVVRLFAALEGVYDLRGDDVWTLFHNYVFDFTVWEMWGALRYGGRLVVPTFEETRDPELLFSLCRRERVTVLCQTPTAFYQFVNVAVDRGDELRVDDLRYVFFGGEPLNVSLLGDWFAHYPHHRPKLAMGYGTTETTVFTCYKIYGPTDEGSTDIGQLIPDVGGYVLAHRQRPLPMGAVGELHIGGAGLAPSYLNAPELTAGKFIRNPFHPHSAAPQREPNARLYKSGDLVRWAPDRSLRFVGRNDRQVKIRGHRIELGEVEAALSNVPGVVQCAVVVRQTGAESGQRQLVGYYVVDAAGPGVGGDALSDHLRATLPEYMVPAALVAMPGLPRTISGKLDVDALPAATLTRTRQLIAPRTKTEAQTRQVMAEVLGVDPDTVSVHDDFFQLGGNSILSIKLVSRLSAELGADVSVAAIFRHRSVADLVENLAVGRSGATRIRRSDSDTSAVLSFAQERLWFVDRYERGTDLYNIHLCYEIGQGVDLDLLEGAFRDVYERHEILRTVIRQDTGGVPYQVVLEHEEFQLVVRHATVAGTGDLDRRLRAEGARHFDLAAEAPFRVTFYRSGGRNFVGILVHHIAFDGWSADLMLTELDRFYEHRGRLRAGLGTTLGLPELTIQYRDYARWERDRVSGDRLGALLSYWCSRLAGRMNVELPTDRPRPPTVDHRGGQVVLDIDQETSAALRHLARETGAGLFSVLLSAFYLLVGAYTKRTDLVVGVPALNRAHQQTHDLIGCFVNSLALDFDIDCDEVVELIKKVAARVVEAQEHQDLPFERLVAELALPVDPSRHPVFQLWFDVQSFAETGIEKPDHAPLLRMHATAGRTTDGESTTTSTFDFGAVINDGGESLVANFIYATSLYEQSTVERIAATYRLILEQFVRMP